MSTFVDEDPRPGVPVETVELAKPYSPRTDSEFEYVGHLVIEQARSVTELHGKFASPHEVYGVLCEELDEFFEEVRKRRTERDPQRMRAELIDIAAAALRAAAEIR